MSRHSVLKGKAGEREFCAELAKFTGANVLVRNLEQSRSGGHDLYMPDDVHVDKALAERLDDFCIEIKRYKRCKPSDISKWWKQACEQADRRRKNPMLAYRLDHQAWKCLVHVGKFPDHDVRGCIAMELELFAEILRHGFKDALSPERTAHSF
ncbi:putative PDDEXK endonuclease [Bacterioplanoides sp.]|uniref:putative PDDEXK endonuclease n=1 Tax=Bacterioplanoides sp. TaxID=2066072 RepID=UPI003B5B2FEA